MKMIRLGKTNYKVNKNGFGALPIQRRNKKDSIEIIQKAYNNGINFYDTARFYTDSEEKLGASLNEVRENVIIATKTGAENAEGFWKDLELPLKIFKQIMWKFTSSIIFHFVQNLMTDQDFMKQCWKLKTKGK